MKSTNIMKSQDARESYLEKNSWYLPKNRIQYKRNEKIDWKKKNKKRAHANIDGWRVPSFVFNAKHESPLLEVWWEPERIVVEEEPGGWKDGGVLQRV